MRNPFLRLSFVLIVSLLSVEETSIACQCFWPPPCEAFKGATCVFIGEVVSSQDSSFGRLGILYTFKVTKVYKGQESKEIQVKSGFGGGDCGYFFERGKEYLVYAVSDQGVLYTDICTRTQELDKTSPDLSYLKNLPKSLEQTHIWGSVMQFNGLTDQYIAFKPRLGIEIKSEVNGNQIKAVTNRLGQFEFVDLPPDSYKFNIPVPPNFRLEFGDAYTQIRLEPHGCTTMDLKLVPDGQISGRVFDPDGKAMNKIEVDLIHSDSLYANNYYLSAIGTEYTYSNGNFTFEAVPPGKYYVGINLRPHPGGIQGYPPKIKSQRVSRDVTLGLGEHLSNIDIRIGQ